MKKIFTFVILSGTLLVLALLLCYVALPYVLNTRIIPHFMPKDYADSVDLKISSLTPFSTTAKLTVGNEEFSDISIPQIEIHYSPKDLIKGKISSITVSGVTIRTILANGKLSLRNFVFPQNSGSEESGNAVPLLPFSITTLQLNNCTVLIADGEQKTRTINFSGSTTFKLNELDKYSYKLRSAQASILFEGQLQAALHLNMGFGITNSISLEGQIPRLKTFSSLLPLPETITVNGSSYLTAKAVFSDNFKVLSSLYSKLTLTDFSAGNETFQISNHHQQPIEFTITGDDKHLNYTLTPLTVKSEFPFYGELQGNINLLNKSIIGTGIFHNGNILEPIPVMLEGNQIDSDLKFTITVSGEKLTFSDESITIKSGPYRLSATLFNSTSGLNLNQVLVAKTLRIPQHELQLKSISSSIKYSFNTPDQNKASPGELKIKSIYYKKENLGQFSTNISQEKNGISFKGLVKTSKRRPIRLFVSGNFTHNNRLTANFSIPKITVNENSLPSFINLPDSLTFSSTLSAKGKIEFDGKKLNGTGKFSLADGTLNLSEGKINLDSITTNVHFPNLPAVGSAPRQQLSLGNISIGNLKLYDGKITYRIEDDLSLNIEKSRFGWCNGTVESGSLHFTSDFKELSTTLYCDRLQFSELLSQLGISDAEGDGSLNGRLPIHFTGKDVTFDNGFLFSTPGNNGIIRFRNTETLRQSMPDLGKAAYLEYSLQAMENFSYNWTKLTFNSVEDDLLIALQIDGKPEYPLPYGYRKGQLVVKPGAKGIQHPIRLDVNFHLPFKEMFKYGQNLQKIMENMQ